MNAHVEVLKDSERQVLIPSLWRPTLVLIVNAIKRNDYHDLVNVPGVRPMSAQDAQAIADNIQDYGVQLLDLPDASWQTSACQWMDGYWDILVDLFSVEEGASDLALVVRVYESANGYEFEVQSVYVP
jgi:hypothetical protein